MRQVNFLRQWKIVFFRVKMLLIIANHLCVMSMYFMPLLPFIGGFGPIEIITLIVVYGVDYPILHHYIEVQSKCRLGY